MSTTFVDDLRDSLPTHITDEQKYDVLESVTDASHAKASHDKLVQDLAESGNRARGLRTNFKTAFDRLSEMETTPGPDGKPLSKPGLAWEWDKLRELYNSTFIDSINLATGIGYACQRFEDHILPYIAGEHTDDQKRKVITDFAEPVIEYLDDARKVKNAFREVADAVSNFYFGYNRYFEDRLGLDHGTMEKYEREIKSIRAQIDNIGGEISKFGDTTGAPLVGFAGISFFPGFGEIAASAATNALKISPTTIPSMMSDLKSKERSLTDEQIKLANTMSVRLVIDCGKAIGGAQTEHGVLATAAGFENAWIVVMNKCRLFKHDITAIKKDFDVKIYQEKKQTSWGPLGEAMLKYTGLHYSLLMAEGRPVNGVTVSHDITTWINSYPVLKEMVTDGYLHKVCNEPTNSA